MALNLNFDERIYLLDGAMGTMLEKSGAELGTIPDLVGITNPALVTDIHKSYIAAGTDIIYACTFGTNRLKLEGSGYSVNQVVSGSVNAAKAACKTDTMVALDVGALGVLLEPMGSFTFEEAYDVFKEVMIAGEKAGADLIAIETMTDLYEVKAAVLAAKENTNLPIFVTMSFEENGRTFTGVNIESMAATLEGLGIDAIGINCSLGPVEILPLAKELCGCTSLPVLIKPNAGLPNSIDNRYDIMPKEFALVMAEYADIGVAMLGGCCGTDPEYIRELKCQIEAKRRAPRKTITRKSVICSATRAVCIDHVAVIGERINPTGKKRLKQALIDEDYDYILSQVIEQVDAGAEILDVNVGIPDINDVEILPQVVKKVQAITDLPLQIDSSNPDAIEAALRVYNGKAIVNSVNGERASMDVILPIVKKYGASVVGLTLDENGIPPKAEERFAIAEKILYKALSFGIPKENVFIDCLTLTASAQQAEVQETLKAVRLVKEKLGLHTVLGVSNISFGLPSRSLVNRTFLALAMENGLDLPIINPNNKEMMDTVYAFEMLYNRDKNAEQFIEKCSDIEVKTTAEPNGQFDIFYTLEKGMKEATVQEVKTLLETRDEMAVVNEYLIPALDKVGKGFEKGTIFLPQMMQAAGAAQAGFEIIKDKLAESGKQKVAKGKVLLATVKGDIHDIGKNIVKVIMENYGYDVIDLGRDVPVELIVETVVKQEIKTVGLSALMTTTLVSMEETIIAVRKEKPDCKFLVGGAVLTADYAEKIGADYYCKDAMSSVAAAREIFGN